MNPVAHSARSASVRVNVKSTEVDARPEALPRTDGVDVVTSYPGRSTSMSQVPACSAWNVRVTVCGPAC